MSSEAKVSMDLKPDQNLYKRYRIIEKLGQGGMGAVYLAWDETLETRVAIKSNFNPAPESVDQFLLEAQLLAALHHRNLPRVTDYFVIGKEQYLVMDFIPGDDLGQRLKEEGRQNLDEVMNWASQLSSALSYMHHQEPPVIHRDIKPANIKLTSEGEAVLVDFGIAKAESVQAQTATGASGYTPGYAPPEQYGQGHTGTFSDQFSLAATLYALLTRTKPVDSIQRLLGKAALAPLQQLNVDIPLNVSDAILRAMSLQPAERFSTINEFSAALRNPNFTLGDIAREKITSNQTGDLFEKTLLAEPPLQGPSGKSTKKKKKKWGLILGITGSALMLCILSVVLLAFVLPKPPFNFSVSNILPLIGLQNPTPTATVRVTDPPIESWIVTLTPTPELQATVVPTTTPTLSPSPTPELLGKSGVIAFASDRGTGDFIQIWTMRVLSDYQGEVYTDSFTQLTFDEGHKDQPVWSPGGTHIAYVAPGRDGNGLDIWLMEADGSNQINLTDHRGDEFDPVWSPDGNSIVFSHHLRDAGNTPIYALTWINLDGTGRQRLSQDFVEWDSTFSPDGNWLLYVISAKSHDYFYFRASYDGFQSPRGFDLRALFGEFGQVSDPAWAPSGNQFAYTRHDGSRKNIVLVTYQEMRPNGLHQPSEYVLTNTNMDSDPAWSPDARWVAFTSLRDGGDLEVYLMTTTGRPQLNLTMHSGVDKSPDWKPSGVSD